MAQVPRATDAYILQESGSWDIGAEDFPGTNISATEAEAWFLKNPRSESPTIKHNNTRTQIYLLSDGILPLVEVSYRAGGKSTATTCQDPSCVCVPRAETLQPRVREIQQ